MKFAIKRLSAFCIFLAIALHFTFAHAGKGVFGWFYTFDLQPKGKLEFEQGLQLNIAISSLLSDGIESGYLNAGAI